MTENIKITMNLMLRDLEVGKIKITLNEKKLFVEHFNVIRYNLLPYALQIPGCNIKAWIMSRLMPSSTHHYIFMIPVIFHKGTDRRPYAQFAMSLETNCISLSDHYWFNPIDDINFYYEDRMICFQHKDWNNINPLYSNLWSDDLNQYLFNDMLFSSPEQSLPAFNNPIFTTNGCKEKIWYQENSDWVLEKRLTNQELINEIECFDFFQQRGILTPNYKIVYHDVADRYQFQPYTIRDGFDTIKKQCLTSKEQQLTPLNWYASIDCEDSICGILKEVKKSINIDESVLKNFENAIKEYKKTYNYEQISASNLGFLVDVNNNAIPVVWSNVGYVEKNPFIKMALDMQK